MGHRAGYRRWARFVLLGLWAVVVVATLYFFFFQREAAQRALQGTMSTSLVLAGCVYLLLGCVRGFTLLPVTSLLVVGVAFFPPWPLLALTLMGIVLSSASVYWFSEALHLEEVFLKPKHVRVMERLKTLLQRHELPIIIGWSFFPLAPTDLIVYVCGVLRVNFWKCLLGVLIGEGAICAIYIFLGDHALRLFHLKA